MRSLITEPLGLYGWGRYEPVLLAALLSEEPLLLVGPHGCAKSFVLERLAESLGMTFRFYNASLINYDDLVGVPLPDATRTKLEYLASPESIWDAQVVFIDEISRTRPELQNKLFPIVYDKRVQGRPLDCLVYRWAAMNPPPTEQELEDDEGLYLGSEPLDAALADRFPYILTVPDWDALSDADRTHVLTDQFAGRHEFPVAIGDLIAEAKECYDAFVPTLSQSLAPYVAALVPKLRAAKYDVSTRRATMLLRCAIAVHAARTVLARRTGEEPPRLYDSALLALLSNLPDRARRKINTAEVTSICKVVWDVVGLDASDPLRELMLITDPVFRLKRMVANKNDIAPDRVAAVIGEGIAAERPARRRGLALATYLAVRERADIPATTIELLAKEISPALIPADETLMVTMAKSQIGRAVGASVADVNARYGADSEFAQYHANLLNSHLPDGLADAAEVTDASADFEATWKDFGL